LTEGFTHHQLKDHRFIGGLWSAEGEICEVPLNGELSTEGFTHHQLKDHRFIGGLWSAEGEI
jgi:hypothetical protein